MNISKYFIILFILITNYKNICTDLPEPYKNIDILPIKLWESWFDNKTALLRVIQKCKPKIVVELGSWLGASTTFIAKNIDDKSKVYAVDIWIETEECAKSTGLPRNELDILFNKLYEQFLSNIIHLKLTDKIIPIRMTTLEAAKNLNIHPDLIYVDASHETDDVYNDIKAWYEKLAPNGIICWDDWGWPTVRDGVIKIAKELNQKLINNEDNMWWFDAKT